MQHHTAQTSPTWQFSPSLHSTGQKEHQPRHCMFPLPLSSIDIFSWRKAPPAKFQCDSHFQAAHAAAAVEEAPQLLLILAGKEDGPLVPDQHEQVVQVQQHCGGMQNTLQPLYQTAHHSCCVSAHNGWKAASRPFLGTGGSGRLAGVQKPTYDCWPEDPAEFKEVGGLLAPLAPAWVAQGPKYQQKGIREAQPQAQQDEVAGKA